MHERMMDMATAASAEKMPALAELEKRAVVLAEHANKIAELAAELAGMLLGSVPSTTPDVGRQELQAERPSFVSRVNVQQARTANALAAIEQQIGRVARALS